MKLLNFLISFLCITITHTTFANSLTCSDFVKLEQQTDNIREGVIDKLELQINTIENTNKSFMSFKFQSMGGKTTPEFAINLNLNQFTSTVKFHYENSTAIFGGTLTPIEYDKKTIFIDLKMAVKFNTENENSDGPYVTGLMQCNWTQPPQQMR